VTNLRVRRRLYSATSDGVVQRYYASSYGRFNTPDPYQAAANGANDPSTPQSWNKYAYVLGDPVNAIDPRGTFEVCCGGEDDGFGDCGGDDWGGGAGIWYDQPPSGGNGVYNGPGGSSTSPPPTPCDFSAQTLLGYMQSTPAYVNGQPSSKPFATLANAAAIMADAVADNVDPRLLVAISFLESKWGGSSGSQRTDNAFGLMSNGQLINFTSSGGWAAGIVLAASTLETHISNGQTSVSSLYSGNPGAYCVGTGCNGDVVANKLTALGGNVNSLASPCYQGSDGQFYEKP